MKTTELRLQTELTDNLQAHLSGLNKKHAKKLQKTVVRTAKKLTKSFARLLAKEVKSREKSTLKATRASVESLVLKLHEILSKRAAGAAG